MNNGGTTTEATAQIVLAVKQQTRPATCYIQRYFITVINAECRVFTCIADDCLIESIKDTDSALYY